MSNQPRSSQDDWEAYWDHYAESAGLNPAQRMRHDLIARLLCESADTPDACLEQAGYGVERIYLAGFPFFNLYRLLVIARGKRLAQDLETKSSGISSALASFTIEFFRLLFHLRDSPFGWQVIAVARKISP